MSATPDVCQVCGCTWDRACPGGCAWANAERTLCTACADPSGFPIDLLGLVLLNGGRVMFADAAELREEAEPCEE